MKNGVYFVNKCPGLSDVYDEDYRKLYEKYSSEKDMKKIKAQDLWKNIV